MRSTVGSVPGTSPSNPPTSTPRSRIRCARSSASNARSRTSTADTPRPLTSPVKPRDLLDHLVGSRVLDVHRHGNSLPGNGRNLREVTLCRSLPGRACFSTLCRTVNRPPGCNRVPPTVVVAAHRPIVTGLGIARPRRRPTRRKITYREQDRNGAMPRLGVAQRDRAVIALSVGLATHGVPSRSRCPRHPTNPAVPISALTSGS